MAESDQRSYRDPAARRAVETPARAQAEDPLAELARLIGQSVPMSRSGQSRSSTPPAAEEWQGEYDNPVHDSNAAQDEGVREPIDDRYSTREGSRYDDDSERHYNRGDDERYDRSARTDPAPSSRFSWLERRALGRESLGQESPGQESPGHETDFAERSAAATAMENEIADRISGERDGTYRDAADVQDTSSDVRDSRYRYDDYENEPHDHSDNHAYGDEYKEDTNRGRRSGFVFVAAIFGLAILGTAGAFAYRAMFGGSVLPTLPPIIKAESGPNKIIPSGASSPGANARQADADGAGSGDRLVSREERPVEVPATATTGPRPVSTVPVFPDPPPAGGPGGVVGFPAAPVPPGNLASSTQPVTPLRGDIPAAPAATMPPAASAAPGSPAGPVTASVTPAAPGPKKIHTVSIRADQANSPDAANASSGQGVPLRPAPQPQGAKPTDANGPLSIVPSSAEGAAPASAPAVRPRPAPAQPVALNKPPANETASAAPAVPVAGGYAVQVSSHRSEEEAQSSFRALQAKYPNLLGGREPIIRRADLGAKGIYYRAMVGPFASADQATDLCSNLKAAGGSCLVQKN